MAVVTWSHLCVRKIILAAIWRMDERQGRLGAGIPNRKLLRHSMWEVVRAWTRVVVIQVKRKG